MRRVPGREGWRFLALASPQCGAVQCGVGIRVNRRLGVSSAVFVMCSGLEPRLPPLSSLFTGERKRQVVTDGETGGVTDPHGQRMA